MYHMELALIMYLCDNDYHARFITIVLSVVCQFILSDQSC